MIPIQRFVGVRAPLLNRRMYWRYALWEQTDTAVASDVLEAFRTSPMLVDVAIGSDALTKAKAVALIDVAVASDALAGLRAATRSVSDTAYGSDALVRSAMRSLLDSAVGSDALGLPLRGAVPLADTAHGADALTGVTLVVQTLTDTGYGSDALTGIAHRIVAVIDTGYASDALSLGRDPAVWVINADTGAISEYQWTDRMDSAAGINGVLLIAMDTGLYALDASEDEDAAVSWRLQTGFSNLGSPLLKRVPDVNLQLRTEGVTQIEVTTDRYGTKQTARYQLPALTRNSYRDGVCKLGKGWQSVFWSIAARGTGPAELDELRPTVEPLSRRR